MAAKPLPLSELHAEQSSSDAHTETIPPPELQSRLQNAGVRPLLDGIVLAWMGHCTSNPQSSGGCSPTVKDITRAFGYNSLLKGTYNMCEVGGECPSASRPVNCLDWCWEEERREVSSPTASGLR